MTVICMYCRRVIGHKPGGGVIGNTSGCCPKCLEIHYPSLAGRE